MFRFKFIRCLLGFISIMICLVLRKNIFCVILFCLILDRARLCSDVWRRSVRQATGEVDHCIQEKSDSAVQKASKHQ